MGKFKLDFGAEIEVLTKSELDDSLDGLPTGIWAQYARGLKHLDLPVMSGAVAGGALRLGGSDSPDQTFCGPRQGFVWRVARISVFGLAANDVVQVYRGDVAASRFVTVLSATAPSFTPSHGLLLKPGGRIVVDGTGLAATHLTVTGEVIEAPGEQIFKLIGG